MIEIDTERKNGLIRTGEFNEETLEAASRLFSETRDISVANPRDLRDKANQDSLPYLDFNIRENFKNKDEVIKISTPAPDLSVDKKDFENKFGKPVADALEKIGCNKIKIEGDLVTMSLADDLIIPQDIGPFNRVALSKEITFKVNRAGQDIKITESEGIALRGRFVPGIGMPSLLITPTSVELKTLSATLGKDPGAHRDLDGILKALSR